MIDNITLLTLVSASFTFILLLIKQAYKSKCHTVDCLCLKISRNINKEVEENKFNIEHNIKDDDIEAIKNSVYIK